MPRAISTAKSIQARTPERADLVATTNTEERSAKIRKAKQDKMVRRSMSAAAAALVGTTGIDRYAMPSMGTTVSPTSNPVAVRIAHSLNPSVEDGSFHFMQGGHREKCAAPLESANRSAPPVRSPLDPLAEPRTDSAAKQPSPLPANDVRVWTHENGVESGGHTKSIALTNVFRFPDGSIGNDRVRVRGSSTPDTLNGHAPYDTTRFDVVDGHGSRAHAVCSVTVDHFDQGLTLAVATELLERLERYGVDLDKLQRAHVNDGKLVIEVNAVQAANAWFDANKNKVEMGQVSGKLNLASDRDVLVHEIGHYLIHQIAGFEGKSRFGGVLHEGLSDVFAVMMHNDAQLGESLRAVGRQHVRTADNEKIFGNGSTHREAESVSGIWWDAKQSLASATGGNHERAADLLMKASVLHLFRYETKSPTPEEFVRHSIDSVAEVLRESGHSDAVIAKVTGEMQHSAMRRNLISSRATFRAS